MARLVSRILIHWIEIYPVNSAIQLLNNWIALFTGYISIQWIAQFVSLILNYWTVIYPTDSAIHLLNTGTTTVTLKNSP